MIETIVSIGLIYILYVLYIHPVIFVPKSTKRHKEPTNKIDITTTRETEPRAQPFFASYNSNRKSKWKTPEIKEDVLNYEKYILSLQWRTSKPRQKTISLDNFSCRMCGSTYKLQVHHITYKNLGKEELNDLATLCSVCHEYTHKIAGKGAGYYPPLQCPETK